MTYNNFFKIAGDLDSEFNESLKSECNYIEKLFHQNLYLDDLQVLEIFLILKKEKNVSAESFLYAYSLADVKQDISIDEFMNDMSKILNINNFDISGNKMGINGFKNLNEYEYRITFSNSSELSFSEIKSFFEKFNSKAKDSDLSYGLKIEPDVTDLIILYLKNNDIEKAIDILERLKTNDKEFKEIMDKFGNKKPFAASVNDSKYGVSMGASRIENERIKGFFAVGNTFTGYMANLIDKSYEELLYKYNGNPYNITSVELYEKVLLLHKKNYGFSEYDDIPLWMNKDNYLSYNNEKNNSYNRV